MAITRLNKFISDCGVTSRRKAEELILQGRVSINDKIVLELSQKIDTEVDIVMLDGERLRPKHHVYFLLNKPKGVVTTTDDEKNRKTVIDLIKTREKIFPVGRLDYDTTGALILTNDGEFSNLLTHPKNKIPRVYEVKLDKPLNEEDKEKLSTGVFIKGKKGRFIKAAFTGKKDKRFVTVTAVEGRNHFVKNMFGALGYKVLALNRNSYAGIVCNIPVGMHRILTREEISGVIENYGN